jgi:hypothetical protein
MLDAEGKNHSEGFGGTMLISTGETDDEVEVEPKTAMTKSSAPSTALPRIPRTTQTIATEKLKEKTANKTRKSATTSGKMQNSFKMSGHTTCKTLVPKKSASKAAAAETTVINPVRPSKKKEKAKPKTARIAKVAPLAEIQQRADTSTVNGTDDTDYVACHCGSKDQDTAMVECSTCNAWVHLICAG